MSPPFRTGLTVQRLRITMAAQEPAVLPGFKGSLLRGAFGWAVRQLACLTRRFDCPGCPVAERCLYAEIFEPRPPSPWGALAGLRTPPRPYVVVPPAQEQRRFEPGEELTWELVLVGRAGRALPYLLMALQAMAMRGLGPRRARFGLVAVTAADGTRVCGADPHQRWQLPDGALDDGAVARLVPRVGERVRVVFVTPTRLVAHGQLLEQPSPGALAQAALRRLQALGELYAEAPERLPVAELMEGALAVRLVRSQVQWRALRRRSARQQAVLSLGGFVGEAVLEGVSPALRHLLAWGRQVHVGKGAVFGLGRYEVEPA